MKKILLILQLILISFAITQSKAQTNQDDNRAIMLFGASFAVPENGWFEMACEDLGYSPINKAVAGEAIYHDAYRMAAGTDYNTEELDRTELLVIMHAHNKNVANEANLKDKWEDYANISTTTDYAVAYDYVIKKYIADCEALEFDEQSKYYGVPGGKQAKIMLCTHWHDGRVEYNDAIRKLAAKWEFPLVEFDTKIGFSKEDNQEDKGAPSREFCADKETLYGVSFGWHPQRGSNREIQQRMASIFSGTVADFMGLEVPFKVTATPLCPIYMAGEKASFLVSHSGAYFPFTVNCFGEESETGFSKRIVKSEPLTENKVFEFKSNAVAFSGEKASASVISRGLVADYVAYPDFDTYISYAQSNNSFQTADVLQLKNKTNSGRKIYVSFPVSENMPIDSKSVILRLYITKYTVDPDFPTYPRDGYETLKVEGNTAVYNQITWGNTNNSTHEQSWANGKIASEAKISSDMVNSWIGIDVTEWVNNTRASLYETHKDYNKGHLTFRLTLEPNIWFSLFEFHSSEGAPSDGSEVNGTFPGGPQLLFASYEDDFMTGVEAIDGSKSFYLEGKVVCNPRHEPIRIFSSEGICLFNGESDNIDLTSFTPGLYIIKGTDRHVKVLI